MRKKLLAIAVILLAALSLSAAYITTVVGEDVYIIDERTGDILSRIRDGEIFDVGYGSYKDEYPIETYSGRLAKYALKVDIRAKFSKENVYLHADVSTEYGAYKDVLEEFSDEGSMISIRFFDSDNFFLGSEDVYFSDAVHIWDDKNNNIVRLSVDKIAEGSENLVNLVDYIDFTYRIGSGVTPSDTYFATKLSVPEWIQGSYYDALDNAILHFTPTDISSEPIEGMGQWFYFSNEITNEKRDAYRYDGIEPDEYFFESLYDGTYRIFHGDYLMEFYPTDNPYVVDMAYDYDDHYQLLRTDYRVSIDIPDWLVGSWSYGESGVVEVSKTDIVIDGTSVVDDATKATIETYLAVGLVDPYIDTEMGEDSFTIYIDGMPTTVSKTDDPLVIEVSGYMVPDNEVLTLTKTVE